MIALQTALASLVLLLSSLQVQAQEVKPDPLDQWLISLEQCESGRNTQIKHLDVDGIYVYGRFQYKFSTFEKAVKKFKFRDEVTKEDILNPDLQFRVTKALIKDNYENWKLWTNCSKQIGLPPVE